MAPPRPESRPSPSPPLGALHALLPLLLVAGAVAQTKAATDANAPAPATAATAAPFAPVALTTPDGSRFVLLPDPSVPQVHWVIVSPLDGSDDPAGCEGLARAAFRTSLRGTWSTSPDPGRERAANADLDRHWDLMMKDPRDEAIAAKVRDLNAAALQFDVVEFARLLAAAPAHRPELSEQGGCGTLALTTVAPALGDVGRLLVERRDQQALRRFQNEWLLVFGTRIEAFAGDPLRPLRAELLALSMPGHPLERALQVPVPIVPTFERAMVAWQRSQHPDRTVHLLFGDFDVTTATATLQATFASTSLPRPDAEPLPGPRALTGSRRSVVPGLALPCLLAGWALPAGTDPDVLEVATSLLADGPASLLGQELAKAGLVGATCAATAPWPAAADGRGLFVLEVIAATSKGGLDELVLRVARTAATTMPDAARLQTINLERQRRWRTMAQDPRALARSLAIDAFLWPTRTPRRTAPVDVTGKQVQELLARTFAGHPVLVEGRP